MALFKRADLKAQGLTDEQIDFVMNEGNRSLAKNYTLTSDVQSQIDTAVQAAKAEPMNIKDSDDYKALQGEFDAYRAMQAARQSDEFKDVKPKFFETVYGMVNRGDGAEPVDKQLEGIRKEYEEYFTPGKQQNNKPTFGAPVEGSMPKGEQGAVSAFSSVWGFGPKK